MQYTRKITHSHNKVFNRLTVKVEFLHCNFKVATIKFQEYLNWFIKEYDCTPIVHEDHTLSYRHTYFLHTRDTAAWVAFKMENS